jgi:hypothetical protein
VDRDHQIEQISEDQFKVNKELKGIEQEMIKLKEGFGNQVSVSVSEAATLTAPTEFDTDSMAEIRNAPMHQLVVKRSRELLKELAG